MTAVLITAAICYIGLLFWLANWGDKHTPVALKISRHPFIYALALGIYCTSWTYYGSVGTAAVSSWDYLPILLGPALLFLFGQRFLKKLVFVSKKQNITTIADFISARYGKRQITAILVTLIALLATIPYIALQLKALGNSFLLIQQEDIFSGHALALTGTLLMAFFAIYFGTRKVDVTEYRSGLMLAVAFESIVKLMALGAVAILAWTTLISLPAHAHAFTMSHWQGFEFLDFNFVGQTLIAAAAIICLPRQFHVTVVDNQDSKHLNTSKWLFPLYLSLIAVMILPITMAAIHPDIGQGLSADSFVLALPLTQERAILTTFVFIGGLSAATAMIVVATLTLSTMLSNDVVLPIFLKRKLKHNRINTNYHGQILLIRRFIIAAILLLAYLYQDRFGQSDTLAQMGLLAFSLVTQLLPAIIGGLYWRKGHAYGVYAGLVAGFICWVLFLILPIFDASLVLDQDARQTLITRGTLIALLANIGCYISFSLGANERLIDKIQAAAFVYPREPAPHIGSLNKHVNATTADFQILLQTFLGGQRAQQLLNHFSLNYALPAGNTPPTPEFINHCERALTGVLGASSAQALIDTVSSGKRMAFEDVINFFDETTQALQFNQNLLYTSLENLSHGISVVDKTLKLVAWNKRYSEMFAYPKGFLQVGLPIEAVIRFNAEQGECGPGEIDEQVRKRVQHLKNGTSHHFIRHRKNGQVYEMVGNPLPEGGFVTSFSDITSHISTQNALEAVNMDLENRILARTEEIRAINNDLIHAKKEAETANDSKTRFLALASHDILQPLNAARLYSAAIDEQPLSTQDQGNFSKLQDSLDSTVHLMSALLDIAKLEQGAMSPSFRHFYISDIFTPLCNEYTLLCQEKDLIFKVRSLNRVVHSDITYLRRIIQNLVSNAVKYTDKGKVLLACRVAKQQLKIEVWDTGIGISEHQQSKIFDDFYRIQKHDQLGVGLGLGVVKRLCELMKIELTVKSTPNKGSCFSINVPFGALSQVKQTGASPSQQNPRTSMHVIAVDDDPNNLHALASLLTKWQISHKLFNNPCEALQYARTHRAPDMILMDYQLGNDCNNGLSVIKQLRDIWQHPVVSVLISAVTEQSLKAEAKKQTVHYLSKPIKPAKLKALLNYKNN